MQTRYMERSNSIARGKRVLDPGCNEDDQHDKKRPALASVIVEALKMDSLQKLCSSLEPILRKVVSEEVERALVKLAPAKLSERVSPKRIAGPGGSNLQLQFRSKLALPLFTGGKVEGEQGAVIHVILLDANTGHIVTSGPGSSVKLDIVVLEGDFNNEDDDGWTQEEFDLHLVKEREGKRPLLTGDVQVTLKEGVGTIGELTFTDNSSWIRSRKFRLGLKVAAGYCEDICIREAKTEAFTVKDHRGELYKKHYPPALNDDVWRLEKIGKDGSFHKRLNKAGISTVEDFLRLVARDLQKLRNILGSGMSNKMWDVLLEHAKTCILSGKLYVYYPSDVRNIGVVFNNIYELSGLIVDNEFHSADSLSDSQKVFVDTLVTKAYDNWMHVIEYDGNSLLSSKVHRDSSSLGSGITTGPHAYFSSNDHQLSLPALSSLPVAVPPEQPSLNPGPVVGGYDNVINRYPMELQNVHFNSPLQFNDPPFSLQSQLDNSPQQIQPSQSENIMAPGPQQSSTSGFVTSETSNLNPYRGFEEFFSEDEIRMKSHEMLENEDMQHLLRVINVGGHGHMTEDGFPYPSVYTPDPSLNYNFHEDQTRSSGKAVVGWLKLKAALRWGIFIRKQAAERRAQIVELDD
ncbi:calmodulin-binding protein 60 D-like [Apium graveolens]|uniref:calmodulin-binding protein 60 D-like n=1 Tax=Apium graveolens TaxID=4045 RepID=UPI003D7A7340